MNTVVKSLEYLVSPSFCFAVTMIKFLQRHFGVNKAYMCLELVLDSFDILGKEKHQRREYILQFLLAVSSKAHHKLSVVVHTCNSNTRETEAMDHEFQTSPGYPMKPKHQNSWVW